MDCLNHQNALDMVVSRFIGKVCLGTLKSTAGQQSEPNIKVLAIRGLVFNSFLLLVSGDLNYGQNGQLPPGELMGMLKHFCISLLFIVSKFQL